MGNESQKHWGDHKEEIHQHFKIAFQEKRLQSKLAAWGRPFRQKQAIDVPNHLMDLPLLSGSVKLFEIPKASFGQCLGAKIQIQFEEIQVAILRIQRQFLASASLILGVTGFLGCGSDKNQEISSATSGYRPSDAPKNDKAVTGSSSSSVADPKPSQSNSAPGASLPTAPTLPEFQLGKSEPTNAEKESQKLTIPKTESPDELFAYIRKNGMAVQELMAETAAKKVSREDALKRAMALGRDMVKASEMLAEVATTDEHRETAGLSKLQALAQMSSMGDVPSSDELRIAAAIEATSSVPIVAEQAAGLLLAFGLGDLKKGTAKSQDISDLILNLLKKKDLNEASFETIMRVIQELEQNDGDQKLELAKSLEAAFRSHPNSQVGFAAWNFAAQRTSGLPKLQKVFQSEELDAAAAEEALTAIIKEVDSPWGAAFLIEISRQFEYSGQMELASKLVKQSEELAKELPSDAIKERIASSCEKYWKRASVMGSEIDFSGLAELDGTPFDFAPYRGKVVVVDVWATWCKPCREELPNVRAMYEKRSAEGVDVIGVNIDDDRSKLDMFLSEEKLPWKTVVTADSTKVGFETPLVERLGISGIPFVAIIGKDGKVAALHSRGPELDKKIAELLAKE
jgi:thiol-disulfide isomerase/thioredoxin